MKALRAARRVGLGLLLVTVVVAAVVASLLAWPQALHPYAARHGRLWLHADQPFDPVAGQALLEEVERRLNGAPPELLEERSARRIVGYGGQVDIEELRRRRLEGYRELDPAASGRYDRYFLLVTHFLEVEGWSVAHLLSSGMSREEAERRSWAAQ